MVYYRDETKLHNVPSVVPAMMMLDFFICLASGGVLLIGLINHSMMISMVAAIILCVGFGASAFCDNYFNWYINCSYDLSKKNKLSYSFHLNGVSVSQNKTVINISKVDKYKISGKKLMIYGQIEKKIPLRPVQSPKKITLQFDFDDVARQAVLDRLNTLKERN